METDRILDEMRGRFEGQGWELEDLLKLQGKTVEGMREELRPQAEERVERSQVTIALVEAEQLSTNEAELDQLVDERMSEMGEIDEELGEQLRSFYRSGEGRMFMANDMMMSKFTERIKAIGRGEAPDLVDLIDEEE
jgi:trigger factor